MAPAEWACLLSCVLVTALCIQRQEPPPRFPVASRRTNLSGRALHPEPGRFIHASHHLRVAAARLDTTSRLQAETLAPSLTIFQPAKQHNINQRARKLRFERRHPMHSTLFNKTSPNNTPGRTKDIRAHHLSKRSLVRLGEDVSHQASGLSFLVAASAINETDQQTLNSTFEAGNKTNPEAVTKAKFENHMARSSHDNNEGDDNISAADQIPDKKPTRTGQESDSSTQHMSTAPYNNLQLSSSNISQENSTFLVTLLTSSSSGADVPKTTLGITSSTQFIYASSESSKSPKTDQTISSETGFTSRTMTGSFTTRSTGAGFPSIAITFSSDFSSRDTSKTQGGISSVMTANTVSGTSSEETTSEPVETTDEPVETTAEQEETSAEPVETTAEPVETAAEPVETTADQEETTSSPDEVETISQETSTEETTLTSNNANTPPLATPNYRTSARTVPSSETGEDTPKAGTTMAQSTDNTELVGADEGSDDDWKIAVGLVVPIVGLVVVLVAVYVCYRKKYPVRMIIGREFGKFSNPKYKARGHAPSLVREDADFYFNSTMQISSQDMNPVNTKRSYDNLGFNKDDSSDEEEKERKFLQRKSWLFKKNSEESEFADKDKSMEEIAESSFIQTNTDSKSTSSPKSARKSSASSSESVVMSETPHAKPRKNKRRAPSGPAHTSNGSTEDTHRAPPRVTSPEDYTKITENTDNVSEVSSSSRKSSSGESSEKIPKSEMTHVNAAAMLGSSLPRNFETQINQTSSKEGAGIVRSLLSTPMKLFDRPSFEQLWDEGKARARSMSLDFIPLEDRERICSMELSKTPRRMSLYEEIVLASKMKALGLPKRPSPLAFEALKKSSSMLEGLNKVSANVVGFDIRDRESSVTSSLGSDQQVGSALSPKQETAQDGTDSTERTLVQDFTPPETRGESIQTGTMLALRINDNTDSQLSRESADFNKEKHNDADNENTKSPCSTSPVSTTSPGSVVYPDDILEQNNWKPHDIQQSELDQSLTLASVDIEDDTTVTDRFSALLESSVQPLGSSGNTTEHQDIENVEDINYAQLSTTGNYSNAKDSSLFQTKICDVSESEKNYRGENCNIDPCQPNNSCEFSSSEIDFNTAGDHLMTKPFGSQTSSSSSSSSSSSKSISSVSSDASSSQEYTSFDLEEGLQTYSFPTSEIDQKDQVDDMGLRIHTDSPNINIRLNESKLSKSKIPIDSPSPSPHGILLHSAVDSSSPTHAHLNQFYQRQISDSSSDSSFVVPRKGALVLNSPRTDVDSLAAGSEHEVKVTRGNMDSQSSSSRETDGHDDNEDILDGGPSKGETNILKLQDSSYSDEDIDV